MTRGEWMSIKLQLAAGAAFIGVAFTNVARVANDHPFTEGPVVNVYAIRTETGKFDDYVNFLDVIWKPTQEAAKKAGYIISYQVIKVEPRGENDPDIYLVTYYKNWAALDGWPGKADALAKEVEGSVAVANGSTVSRGNIRRVLGSWTGQELVLK